jgi:uncharacterized protein (TIGR02996 family)
VSDEDALRRAVLADPDNAGTLLVYADWLEERGDSREEFLRVSAALGALPALERGDSLRARLQELRQAIDPKWLALIELRLPDDLVTYLAAGKQLGMDDGDSEAGAISLLSLSGLKLERFPMETGGLDCYEQDPHYPNVKSYLVLGVNLVAGCTGGYKHVGLLLWLPVERRFGGWDSSHCTIAMFGPDVTWTQIAADPGHYIDANWGNPGAPGDITTWLIPWPAHPYGDKQVYDPQPG